MGVEVVGVGGSSGRGYHTPFSSVHHDIFVLMLQKKRRRKKKKKEEVLL